MRENVAKNFAKTRMSKIFVGRVKSKEREEEKG